MHPDMARRLAHSLFLRPNWLVAPSCCALQEVLRDSPQRCNGPRGGGRLGRNEQTRRSSHHKAFRPSVALWRCGIVASSSQGMAISRVRPL